MRFNFVLFLFAFSSTSVFGQVNDAAIWSSFGFRKKISQKLTFGIDQQLRFNENDSQLGFFNTEFSLAYKLRNNFTLSANYRFINARQLDGSYGKANRYFFDLSYGKLFKNIYFSLRTRFQTQYVDTYSNVFGYSAKNYSRNMVMLKYNINAYWGPYVAFDSYYSLNNPEGNKLDRTLSFVGIIYKPNRIHQFNLYYLIQHQVNVKNPQTDFISGITYVYIF